MHMMSSRPEKAVESQVGAWRRAGLRIEFPSPSKNTYVATHPPPTLRYSSTARCAHHHSPGARGQGACEDPVIGIACKFIIGFSLLCAYPLTDWLATWCSLICSRVYYSPKKPTASRPAAPHLVLPQVGGPATASPLRACFRHLRHPLEFSVI